MLGRHVKHEGVHLVLLRTGPHGDDQVGGRSFESIGLPKAGSRDFKKHEKVGERPEGVRRNAGRGACILRKRPTRSSLPKPLYGRVRVVVFVMRHSMTS